MWQEPVTNRTEKAFLNSSDLNRIDNNINFLANCFGILVRQKEWKRTDFFTIEKAVDLLEDVKKIRKIRLVNNKTPAVPKIPLVFYWQINDIEKILKDVHELYMRNIENQKYTGEFYTSEKVGVL